jgi:hypothetical protein
MCHVPCVLCAMRCVRCVLCAMCDVCCAMCVYVCVWLGASHVLVVWELSHPPSLLSLHGTGTAMPMAAGGLGGPVTCPHSPLVPPPPPPHTHTPLRPLPSPTTPRTSRASSARSTTPAALSPSSLTPPSPYHLHAASLELFLRRHGVRCSAQENPRVLRLLQSLARGTSPDSRPGFLCLRDLLGANAHGTVLYRALLGRLVLPDIQEFERSLLALVGDLTVRGGPRVAGGGGGKGGGAGEWRGGMAVGAFAVLYCL